jgi:hypothetical protein
MFDHFVRLASHLFSVYLEQRRKYVQQRFWAISLWSFLQQVCGMIAQCLWLQLSWCFGLAGVSAHLRLGYIAPNQREVTVCSSEFEIGSFYIMKNSQSNFFNIPNYY